MTNYTIQVTEAELAVVALALGRMLSPKPVVERKPAGPKVYSHGKPPKLNDGLKMRTEEGWKKAVEDPAQWRTTLAYVAANNTGRMGNVADVEKAWGISA
jgi:hypothetical protein